MPSRNIKDVLIREYREELEQALDYIAAMPGPDGPVFMPLYHDLYDHPTRQELMKLRKRLKENGL